MKHIDEQRYLWLFRAFSVLLVLSVVANIVLLSAYLAIAPEPKQEAFFVDVQTGTAKEFYVQRPKSAQLNIAIGSVGYEIAEAYIADYVVNRESVYSDGMLMQKLWGFNGPVYYYSSKDVYSAFVRSVEYRNSLINRDRYVVSVEVGTPQYQPQAKLWVVDATLKTTDKSNGTIETKNKRIQITADYMQGEEKLNSADMWNNPLGFRVTSYKYL